MILYTDSVSRVSGLLELTRCTCLQLRLDPSNVDQMASHAVAIASSGRVSALIFDSIRDLNVVSAFLERVRGINIYCVGSNSRLSSSIVNWLNGNGTVTVKDLGERVVIEIWR